jgi:hypothetical protein
MIRSRAAVVGEGIMAIRGNKGDKAKRWRLDEVEGS